MKNAYEDASNEKIAEVLGQMREHAINGYAKHSSDGGGFGALSWYDDAVQEAARRLTEDVVRDAAKALFDNCISGEYPVEPVGKRAECWAALGAALYGEDDERVKALRPATFKPGDWVCLDRQTNVFAMIVVSVDPVNRKVYVHDTRPSFRNAASVEKSASQLRLATPEEIAAAIG